MEAYAGLLNPHRFSTPIMTSLYLIQDWKVLQKCSANSGLQFFMCEIHPDILEPQMKTLPPLCHQQSSHKSYKREPMEVTAWWIADSDETATANTERVGMLKGNPAAVTPLRNEGSPMKATVRVNRNIAESCVVAASFYVSPRRNAMLPADGLTPMNFGFALVPWM